MGLALGWRDLFVRRWHIWTSDVLWDTRALAHRFGRAKIAHIFIAAAALHACLLLPATHLRHPRACVFCGIAA